MDSTPSLQEVLEQLEELSAGRKSCQQVAAWASQWVFDDDASVDNALIWETLTVLAKADTEIAPGRYLYTTEDYSAWLSDLRERMG